MARNEDNGPHDDGRDELNPHSDDGAYYPADDEDPKIDPWGDVDPEPDWPQLDLVDSPED